MVENFEEQTHELTDYEQNQLLPIIKNGLLTKKGEANAVTSTEVVKSLKEKGYKIDPARLRKIINYIRVNNEIFNLVATSKGYYIATTQGECLSFIRSLDQRANAIITVRDAMQFQHDLCLKGQTK